MDDKHNNYRNGNKMSDCFAYPGIDCRSYDEFLVLQAYRPELEAHCIEKSRADGSGVESIAASAIHEGIMCYRIKTGTEPFKVR